MHLAAAAKAFSRHHPSGALPLLGEHLVQAGVIDRHELFRGLTTAHQHDCRLGDALVWLGLVSRLRLEAEEEIRQLRWIYLG